MEQVKYIIEELLYRPLLQYHSNVDGSSLEMVRANRALIAHLIQLHPQLQIEAEEYLNHLAQISGIEHFIAHQLAFPDSTTSHPTKNEPNLFETIWATHFAKKQYQNYLSLISKLGPVIPIGSLTYAPYYWITDSVSRKRPSDLDFEVIIDSDHISSIASLDFWSDADDYQKFCTQFRLMYQSRRADFGTYRAQLDNGLHIDCHFVPQPTLQKICSLDLRTIQDTVVLHEFRMHPKVKNHIYKQRNFDGGELTFEGKVVFDGLESSEGIIFEVPHVILDKQSNRIGLGYSFDKYLAVANQPIIGDSNSTVTAHILTLAKNIAERCEYEQRNSHIETTVTQALTASERMNPIYRSELEQFFQTLKKA